MATQRRFALPLLWAIPALIVIVSWITFCVAAAMQYPKPEDQKLALLFEILAVAAPLGGWLAFRVRSHWWPRLRQRLGQHTDEIDAMSPHRLWVWTALAAALGLYLELVLIRFHASAFQLFGFFKNISLLSCFLGLGIGYAIGTARPLLTPLLLPMLCIQVLFMHLLRFTDIGDTLQNPIAEDLKMGLGTAMETSRIVMVFALVVWVFSYNSICMIPLGQLASRLMGRSAKLPAYSWNLLGSLLGVLAFYGVSFLWMPPAVWFALAIAGLMVFLRRSLVFLLCSTLVLAVLATSFSLTSYDLYSPYQILTVKPVGTYPEILVNHAYFQRIINLSPGVARDDMGGYAEGYYNLPYLFAPHPENELIVGSGSGNDVAAAVRHDAAHIDAVEIDPTILDLGKELHPEFPYQSPTVTPHVQDARAFIRYSRDKYDLIVYGLLDSHTLLSGMGGVRLDSYIYTVEAFREARARLKPNGVLSLSFCTYPQLYRKMYRMLQEAFDGQPPLVYQSRYDAALTYLAGNNVALRVIDSGQKLEPVPSAYFQAGSRSDLSTDDWPFFYMPTRHYPVSYLVMIAVLLATAVLFIAPVLQLGGGKVSAPCFLLGAGFMLLETKAITELALFYGSTWVVIGVVIVAILIMAFLANLLVMKIPTIPLWISYLFLLASVALSWWFPTVSHAIHNEWAATILATTIITLPLFFSGVVFSSEMNGAQSVAAAFGSNLIGAMLGGCLEYNSMYFGYRSLYVLALAIYAISALVSLLRPATPARPDIDSDLFKNDRLASA